MDNLLKVLAVPCLVCAALFLFEKFKGARYQSREARARARLAELELADRLRRTDRRTILEEPKSSRYTFPHGVIRGRDTD